MSLLNPLRFSAAVVAVFGMVAPVALSCTPPETSDEPAQEEAVLEFRAVHPESDTIIARIEDGGAEEPGWVILPAWDDEGRPMLVSQEVELDGSNLKEAPAYREAEIGWNIAIEFNGEGADDFRLLSERNVGKLVAIVFGGKILSSPYFHSPIGGGRAVISGAFSAEEAKALAEAIDPG